MAIRIGDPRRVTHFVNQTDLLAGTTQQLISPETGQFDRLTVVVQVAVTTGGVIKVQADDGAGNLADVPGLSVTVADAAPAGTVYTATATAGANGRNTVKNRRFAVVLDAAFNSAGAVSLAVDVEPNKTPAKSF